MPKFTVAGHLVDVDEPYNEGHVCTAGEADALNQVRKENIRNNVVSSLTREYEKANKDPKTAPIEEVQSMVNDYAKDYEFGVRGGASRDPIEMEALDMARQIVKDAISKKPDLKLKDFPAKKITELAANYLAGPSGNALRERAKAVVEARSKVMEGLGDVQLAA